MSKFLNRFQRDELKGQHRFESEKRYADRIKALLLWDDGWTLEQISEVLLLNEKTIRRYRELYETYGIDRLLNDDWKGSVGKLSFSEEQDLKEYLVSNLCQTTPIPGKANPEAQEKFIAMYEELMDQKSDEDPVYFIDGVHAQHNSHPTNGWILRGKEHHIATNTGRQRININGTLNAETLEVYIWEDQTINAQSTMALFATIQQKHPDAKNIYVILDNAGYYRNRLVNYYVENSPIKLLFLPPYSPNLNLIERLWKFFKKKVANNRYYEKFQDFKKEALRFFEKLQIYESELDSLLVDNFQIIRPDFSS